MQEIVYLVHLVRALGRLAAQQNTNDKQSLRCIPDCHQTSLTRSSQSQTDGGKKHTCTAAREKIHSKQPRSINNTPLLSHPFLSLCCLEFTNRTVMFWSMKRSTVLMSAGKKAAHLAHTGRVMKGTSQGRPTVVVSAIGTLRVGSMRAYLYKEVVHCNGRTGRREGMDSWILQLGSPATDITVPLSRGNSAGPESIPIDKSVRKAESMWQSGGASRIPGLMAESGSSRGSSHKKTPVHSTICSTVVNWNGCPFILYASLCSPTHLFLAQIAANVPVATPMVGAKSATISRIGLLKNGVLNLSSIDKSRRQHANISRILVFFETSAAGEIRR